MEVRALRVVTTGLMFSSMVLMAITLGDLFTTILWIQGGHAIEINPFMASLLDMGWHTFIAVKLATIACFVVFIEWYARNRDRAFAVNITWFTVVSYLAIYTVSFSLVNFCHFAR